MIKSGHSILSGRPFSSYLVKSIVYLFVNKMNISSRKMYISLHDLQSLLQKLMKHKKVSCSDIFSP